MIWRERELVDDEKVKGLVTGLKTAGAIEGSSVKVIRAMVVKRTKLSWFQTSNEEKYQASAESGFHTMRQEFCKGL